jgi:hypothetical protein
MLHRELLRSDETGGRGAPGAFGLVAVDCATQRRTIKDSARYLGGIARRNALA